MKDNNEVTNVVLALAENARRNLVASLAPLNKSVQQANAQLVASFGRTFAEANLLSAPLRQLAESLTYDAQNQLKLIAQRTVSMPQYVVLPPSPSPHCGHCEREVARLHSEKAAEKAALLQLLDAARRRIQFLESESLFDFPDHKASDDGLDHNN